MKSDKLVIGLVGMPGSGKSLVVEVAQQRSYAVVTMGDVVREETLRFGLELTPENVGKVMLELRKANGEGVVAQKCVPKIELQKNKKVLVDGLRSLHEVKVFKSHFRKFTLLAIHACPETRFIRLLRRGRTDDPKKWETFNERDLRELSVGLGNIVAMSENLVVNEGEPAETKEEIKETLRRVEEEWQK